ncbi:MAG: GNAT family N-acetyltransferase [Bacillota bacterium]
MYKKLLKLYETEDNVDIHKIEFDGSSMYFIHKFRYNDLGDRIESGCIYMIYKDIGLNRFHSHTRPVLEYRIVHTVQDISHIELSNMYIEEQFRNKGIGSLLLRYFESKVISKYFYDMDSLKGVLLMRSENKLKKFYKKNGFEVKNGQIKKKINRIYE